LFPSLRLTHYFQLRNRPTIKAMTGRRGPVVVLLLSVWDGSQSRPGDGIPYLLLFIVYFMNLIARGSGHSGNTSFIRCNSTSFNEKYDGHTFLPGTTQFRPYFSTRPPQKLFPLKPVQTVILPTKKKNRWYLPAGPNSVTTQKTSIAIFTNLTSLDLREYEVCPGSRLVHSPFKAEW
jgi:hypothetical protein